jgi:hypothetical protein
MNNPRMSFVLITCIGALKYHQVCPLVTNGEFHQLMEWREYAKYRTMEVKILLLPLSMGL